jgi:hypothetical protein
MSNTEKEEKKLNNNKNYDILFFVVFFCVWRKHQWRNESKFGSFILKAVSDVHLQLFGSSQWPEWLTEKLTSQQHQISFSTFDDFVGLVWFSDSANSTRGNCSFLANPGSKWNLVAWNRLDLLMWGVSSCFFFFDANRKTKG